MTPEEIEALQFDRLDQLVDFLVDWRADEDALPLDRLAATSMLARLNNFDLFVESITALLILHPKGCQDQDCLACSIIRRTREEIRRSERAQSDLESEWVQSTMRFCLAGDRIRLGLEETDVLRSSLGTWRADTRDEYRPKGWEHEELRMELTAVPGFTQYPPNASVEILCTPERKAALLLQDRFPGSTIL